MEDSVSLLILISYIWDLSSQLLLNSWEYSQCWYRRLATQVEISDPHFSTCALTCPLLDGYQLPGFDPGFDQEGLMGTLCERAFLSLSLHNQSWE